MAGPPEMTSPADAVEVGSWASRNRTYLIAAGLCGVAGFGLMIYAGVRETTTNDKSPTMTPKQIAVVLAVVVAWLVLVIFNEGLFGLPAESELNDSTPVTPDEAR